MAEPYIDENGFIAPHPPAPGVLERLPPMAPLRGKDRAQRMEELYKRCVKDPSSVARVRAGCEADPDYWHANSTCVLVMETCLHDSAWLSRAHERLNARPER
jgi:hypothetical protein